MLIFDASNRDECIVERVRTETPLQALVMMNDPLVLEASRVFAARLLKDPLQDVERIDKAFRTILGRRPDENELAVLTDYHQEQLQRLRSNPEEADQLLNVGEYVFPEPIAEVECAALMQVISTIYNLEEAIVKS
jgi:hypothetical protein